MCEYSSHSIHTLLFMYNSNTVYVLHMMRRNELCVTTVYTIVYSIYGEVCVSTSILMVDVCLSRAKFSHNCGEEGN